MRVEKIVNVAKLQTPNIDVSKNVSSNPFGVSFKGSMIQADVFESSTPGVVQKISSKSKMLASALVGNINNFNEALKARMNSAVSFGRKLANNVNEQFDKIMNYEISLDFNGFGNTIKNALFPNSQYRVGNLKKLPVDELRTMMQTEIAALNG